MQITKRAIAGLKAIGVICAVMVVAGGVTFAALQSQNVVLQGNRLTSATANLLVGNGDGQYLATTPGFNFDNVEPGGSPMPVAGNTVHLRNSGTSDLHLRMALNSNMLRNLGNISISKVFLQITPPDNGAPVQVSLGALYNAHASNTSVPIDIVVPAGQDVAYQLRMQMAADAVTSSTSVAVMENIDLIFSGITQAS